MSGSPLIASGILAASWLRYSPEAIDISFISRRMCFAVLIAAALSRSTHGPRLSNPMRAFNAAIDASLTRQDTGNLDCVTQLVTHDYSIE